MEGKLGRIVDLLVYDLRFPTSLGLDGSDASHPDPDYSAVYVVLKTGFYSAWGSRQSRSRFLDVSRQIGPPSIVFIKQ
jgi:hypothetical protein